MSHSDSNHDESERFPEGLYDRLATEELREVLGGENPNVRWEKVDPAELYDRVAAYYAHELAQTLSTSAGQAVTTADLSRLVQSLFAEKKLPLVPAKSLTQIGTKSVSRPETPLALSALLTGSSRSPSLRAQLVRELQSCDRADWLVSFIKFSGLRPLLDALREFTATPAELGPRLRIATTSYMGATDIRAIEELLKLPNTEVRVSYDTHRTRLHAKAYLFYRHTGFGSAYIGSANLSKHAIDEGLEWTAKISQAQLPYLWQQATATFESHWRDEVEFTRCTLDSVSEFHAALNAQRAQPDALPTFFDLRPYTFQKAILEDIADERSAGKDRHLVIAATGTGKTMIAAFDYRAFAKGGCNRRPSLLFLAHREEILKQACDSFRAVLRDGRFGEIKTGQTRLTQDKHVFCTVQSWRSQLGQLPANHFDYVVLDEAHHAKAQTYEEILDYLRPVSLLGLTATPERLDGGDIRARFAGTYTHELRLGDAIDGKLLVPFHYYGISDLPGLSLEDVQWRGTGYDQAQLTDRLCSDERAGWVLEQAKNYVAELQVMKAIAFCVSIKHANHMAAFAAERGIGAIALTSQTSREERIAAQRRLQTGELQLVCTVDLYNEGVDLPFVDAVLLLRPTESLTIFLQQIGRGLRTFDNKSHLTILDYIAPQHDRFNYADRFRAFSSNRSRRIDDQISAGMPYVPAGCFVQLERQASETVLANIGIAARRLKARRIQQELRALWEVEQRRPELTELLNALLCDTPDAIYRLVLPSMALDQATNREIELEPKQEMQLRKGLRRLLRIDDSHLLDQYCDFLNGKACDQQIIALVHSVLWGAGEKGLTLTGSKEFLRARPGLTADLLDLVDWKRSRDVARPFIPCKGLNAISVHGSYTREQVILAAGHGTFEHPVSNREGVLHVPERKLDIFFADIHKSEADFSPTTMYQDYAITQNLFHWQSQSATHSNSRVGRRYIEHEDRGYTPLLFIRDRKKDAAGMTTPYLCAGPLCYRGHEGNRPISFSWELETPLPARAFSWAQQAG